MPVNPPTDRQVGVGVGDYVSASNQAIAHGDRRDEVHYEPDADQLTWVSYLVKPEVLPPDEVSRDPFAAAIDVLRDAGVMPPAPSVWDASPPETAEGAETAGRHGG